MNETFHLIVSRHAGAIEWLRKHGIEGEVVSHATEENVRGREVYGVLPLHLAALASRVYCIDMQLAPEDRGRDLSAEEMEARGAHLCAYRVLSGPALAALDRLLAEAQRDRDVELECVLSERGLLSTLRTQGIAR